MTVLDGIKLLDFSRLTPGAYASMLLADLGCDVIKIERPGSGDYMRDLVPGGFEGVNRSKKSLTLDLKTAEGQGIAQQLARESDVILESFRPGVAGRLGIDHATLQRVNERIVYCSLTGYGQTGPRREETGHDLNYLGVAGALSLMGEPTGPPANCSRIVMADLNGGMFAAMSILTALLARAQRGTGEYIDVSITDAMVSWMGRFLVEYQVRPGADRASMMRQHGYGVYGTKDGRYVTLACLESHFWLEFLDRLPSGCELQNYRTDEQRDAEHERIEVLLRDLFAERTAGEWLNAFAGSDVPIAPVNTFLDVFDDPGLIERDLFEEQEVRGEPISTVRFPVRFANAVTRPIEPPPRLGQHTQEVLRELGLSDEVIAGLRERGVV